MYISSECGLSAFLTAEFPICLHKNRGSEQPLESLKMVLIKQEMCIKIVRVFFCLDISGDETCHWNRTGEAVLCTLVWKLTTQSYSFLTTRPTPKKACTASCGGRQIRRLGRGPLNWQGVSLDLYQLLSLCRSKERKGACQVLSEGIASGTGHSHWAPPAPITVMHMPSLVPFHLPCQPTSAGALSSTDTCKATAGRSFVTATKRIPHL